MDETRKNNDNMEKRKLMMAQDMKFIKVLSGNDKNLRNKALQKLKKWLQCRGSKMPFTSDEYLRIWKGLFYAMWMSDKPLIQEECAENIANLIHFTTPDSRLLFFKSGLTLIANEWFGIDQWRMNKFLMFVRRILRQAIEVLKKSDWKLDTIQEFGDILLESILTDDCSTHLSLTMHITEIYLEELAKVSNGKIDKATVKEFLRPFVKHLSILKENRQITQIQKHVFRYLIEQSDVAAEHQAKFEAWKMQGFPEGTIDAMERIETENSHLVDEDDDLEGKPLDPRAGQVDVILPQLQFDALEILQLLRDYKFLKETTTSGRIEITKLEKEFEKVSRNIYPFGFTEINLPEFDGYSIKLRKSVNRLVKLEKNLLLGNKRRRKRKISKKQFNSADLFEDKLQKFISKSEGKLLKSKKIKRRKTSKLNEDWTFENQFDRNSGTWVVHSLNLSEIEEQTPVITNGTERSAVENEKLKIKSQIFQPNNLDGCLKQDEIKTNKSDKLKRKFNLKIKQEDKDVNGGLNHVSNKQPNYKSLVLQPSDGDATPKEGETDIFISSNKFKQKFEIEQEDKNVNDGLSCVSNKLVKEPIKNEKSVSKSIVFRQNEWDVPPKEGETEIFVPANKFKKKMELKAKQKGQSLNDVLNNSLKKLVNQRYSLDNNLLAKNRFSHVIKTPQSEKKVKIDLKLNKSQEIDEHRAQLKSSPAIPFDANRKPSKPLLKSNSIKSPINPFYRKKLSL